MRHDLTKHSDTSPYGGPTWLYRGVEIIQNEKGTLFAMPRPPAGLTGLWDALGNKEHLMQVIDAWLDTGRLPAPYVERGG